MKKNRAKPIFVIAAGLAFMVGLWSVRSGLQPQLLAAGEFHQVAHKGEGTAEILKKPDGERSLILRNFRTARSGDLFVYLISARDARENETVKNSKIRSLGRLKNAETLWDEYPLPAGLDISLYGAVTVWNEKYGINFTTAPLVRKADS